MKKKVLITALIAGALAIGGVTATHAATYTSYTSCSSGKSVSLHLTGRILSDGGTELIATMPNGDICDLTSNGQSIGAKRQGIKGDLNENWIYKSFNGQASR